MQSRSLASFDTRPHRPTHPLTLPAYASHPFTRDRMPRILCCCFTTAAVCMHTRSAPLLSHATLSLTHLSLTHTSHILCFPRPCLLRLSHPLSSLASGPVLVCLWSAPTQATSSPPLGATGAANCPRRSKALLSSSALVPPSRSLTPPPLSRPFLSPSAPFLRPLAKPPLPALLPRPPLAHHPSRSTLRAAPFAHRF